ncbi:hypothetical protein L873DRAFT_1819345 [Choiromyces venosus 120613-1]|uniref:Uncharacterized protein n=1 Tax=Choiromyces venosus 120613-1 TaxID=1336337 RepID=A0A3N4J4Y7_9PEZI|nr:hypothetical protein L873DRAFT_1819345 [Choiromyces venosus 120613-1]
MGVGKTVQQVYGGNRLKGEPGWNTEIIRTDASCAKQLPRHGCCSRYDAIQPCNGHGAH